MISERLNAEERCREILESNGGTIADKARTILLEEPQLNELRPALKFVSKNWRNPLTPALMNLSCEAVGGQSKRIHQAALAMTLMSLSFYVWDDLLDKTRSKRFKPTLYGKFGEGTSLIVGGLASAKAFSILNQLDVDKPKAQATTQLFWNLWTTVAQAESRSFEMRKRKDFSSRRKFSKIKEEAKDLETCLKVGATLGEGSESEIATLGEYGHCLGMILELRKDFQVSMNMTLELAEKIRSHALPYYTLRAMERSNNIRDMLNLAGKKTDEKSFIAEVVENTLGTKALDNALDKINRYAKKAGEELQRLKPTSATQELRFLAEAQSELFADSLSSVMGMHKLKRRRPFLIGTDGKEH